MSDSGVSGNDADQDAGVLEISANADKYGYAGGVDTLRVGEVEEHEGWV